LLKRISVSEFINDQRKEAYRQLRLRFKIDAGKSEDPLHLLVAYSLRSDRNGDIHLRPDLQGAPNQRNWDVWNRAKDLDPKQFNQVVEKVLEWENLIVPEDPENLQEWAAFLVLETLDRLNLSLA
jgi:hypothetical protein